MKTRILLLLSALILFPFIGYAQEYEPKEISEAMCLETLKTWNDALNDRDEVRLATVYNDVVKFYQDYLTDAGVRNSHSRFFKKKAYYHQYYDNVTFDFINGCQAQVRFNKHVQTEKDGTYTIYVSYLHMALDGDNNVVIIGESDETTDKNLAKRKTNQVKVDNNTPLNNIFCEANVNKYLEASYWDLVEMGEKQNGPLASFLMMNDLPRSNIHGVIKKDFQGQKGTYYCGGFVSAGECGWPVIFVYNPTTGEQQCYWGEEE